jgi:hypothetical protein
MARTAHAPDLAPYRPALQTWMPNAEIHQPAKALGRFHGRVTWRTAGGTVRYLAEEKRHLRHQDVGVVVDQLKRLRAGLPAGQADDRILLLAPHVRAQQARVLQRAEIDYLDLVGNVHLQAPGLFVHVEGRQPTKEIVRAGRRPHKGWIKTVMALLIQPDLVQAPYRVLAEHADVALGTVADCMGDLIVRGLMRPTRAGRRMPDRHALIALWVQAYVEGLRPRLTERRLQVRANAKEEIWTRLQTVLGARGQRWALTGADAAERQTHYFRTEETELYAPLRTFDDREMLGALVAQPAARTGNVLVIEPPGPLAIPAEAANGLPVAPDLLAYAELRYRGTGQALEAADLLLPRVLGDAAD